MSKRWNSLTDHAPPVSTETRRYWLELYIPSRAQGATEAERRKALATGLHLGAGKFRCVGDRNLMLERVSHWRPIGEKAVRA